MERSCRPSVNRQSLSDAALVKEPELAEWAASPGLLAASRKTR